MSAARGEGLAGLAEDPKVELRRTIKDLFAMGHGVLARRLERVETALEAAAPAGTARKPSYEECRKLINALAGDWHNNLTNVEVYALADKYLVPFLAALATPSPQAPPEQSNAFSTTSAREQSAATASANLLVGDVVLAKSWAARSSSVPVGEQPKEKV